MKIKLLDGGMGTMLQEAGMKPGMRTEIFGMQNPGILNSIHQQYVDNGSDIIYSNTFGANAHKLKGCGVQVEDVIEANVKIAKEAAQNKALVALDIGPIGELMEPLGTLKFDEAYDVFKQMVIAGEKAGADLVVFETMSDLSELRAGVLAASENSKLPIWTTMSFEMNGRTFTGTTVASFAMTMDALPVEAMGVNCSLGPEEILPFIKEMKKYTNKPLIAKPNAGLPDPVSGKYAIDAMTFARQMEGFSRCGATYLGGCCGTTPQFISELKNCSYDICEDLSDKTVTYGVCSAGKVVDFDEIRVIGERINPTGKKRLQQALMENDLNYIMKCAIEQQDAGADILDINVGLPGLNEAEMMKKVVMAVQSVTDLPLQIDSSDPAAIEAGLRYACGVVIVNSVNGEEDKLDTILPLVKKYGACVIGLTIDNSGLPKNSIERVRIAERIIERARYYNIEHDKLIIDCLALTISSMPEQAIETLDAIHYLKDKYSLHMTLGVSNISFGLPDRNNITTAFLTQAAYCGLDLPIVNPNIKAIMDTICSVKALLGQDKDCSKYIDRFANTEDKASGGSIPNKKSQNDESSGTIEDAVLKGLGAEVEGIVLGLLSEMEPMDIINNKLIPALDVVGEQYEKGKLFLPQLISAANAASCGFEVIKKKIAKEGSESTSKGTIIMATVEGDIHDIGKNIVKVVLENYGYRIIDLGKDVPVKTVVDTAIAEDVKLIGLSALMTTTVDSMKRTIEALRASGHQCKVFVGGAVLTEEYAQRIGADYYAKDAKASADIAKAFFA